MVVDTHYSFLAADSITCDFGRKRRGTVYLHAILNRGYAQADVICVQRFVNVSGRKQQR